MDFFFHTWLLLLLVQGCTTGDTVDTVYDYIQSVSAEEGVTFNANDVNTKQKCAVHDCVSPVLDCRATNRILPLSLSPLYLWPTYLGTASLGSVHAGSQHESLAYMRALQEILSAAFKEGTRSSCDERRGWSSSDWKEMGVSSDAMHWLMTMVHCIVSQYIANVNEKEGLFNTSGSEIQMVKMEVFIDAHGCYQPLQSRAAGDMVVLVGIGVGESDVHSNVVYFKDPRPGAGTLEVQGWLPGTVPYEWEMKAGEVVVFPSYLEYHLVANRNHEHRMYIMIDISLGQSQIPETTADIWGASTPGFQFLPSNITPSAEGREAACHHLEVPELKVHDHWVTPVLVVDLLQHEEFHFKLAQLALDMEMNSPSVQKSNKGGWQSFGDLFEGEDSLIQELRNWTYTCVYNYLRSSRRHFLPSGSDEWWSENSLHIDIDVAWASVNRNALPTNPFLSPLRLAASSLAAPPPPHRKLDSNSPHIHPYSAVSGVYYASLGDDSATSIYFLDPRIVLRHSHSSPWGEHSRENRVKAAPGRLVIFPGWLEHHVKPHTTDQPRVSISFNTKVTQHTHSHTGGERNRGRWCYSYPSRHVYVH